MRVSCGAGMPPATISRANGSRCRNDWSRRATVSVMGGRTRRILIVQHLFSVGPLRNEHEPLPVLVIPEDHLPPVAPVHDMICHPRRLDAQLPSHAPSLRSPLLLVQERLAGFNLNRLLNSFLVSWPRGSFCVLRFLARKVQLARFRQARLRPRSSLGFGPTAWIHGREGWGSERR